MPDQIVRYSQPERHGRLPLITIAGGLKRWEHYSLSLCMGELCCLIVTDRVLWLDWNLSDSWSQCCWCLFTRSVHILTCELGLNVWGERHTETTQVQTVQVFDDQHQCQYCETAKTDLELCKWKCSKTLHIQCFSTFLFICEGGNL